MTGWRDFKKALVEKLSDEGTYFTASYIIKLKDYENGFAFTIKDYEHIVYTVSIDKEVDEDFAKLYGDLFARISTNEADGLWCDWGRDANKLLLQMAKLIGYRIGTTY